MKSTDRFETAPNVAAEIIDGEAILIRLDDGLYFSMNAVGSLAWRLLTAGANVQSMLGALEGIEQDRARDTAADLGRFLETLEEQRLIVDASAATPVEPGVQAEPPPSGYEAPSVVAYDDMAALLALDPPRLS